MIATGTRSFVAVAVVVGLSALGLPQAAVAGDAVSVLGMAWTPKPAPALVVSASGPLAYVEARPEPGVLLLDFADAVVSKEMAPVAEPTAGLRRATLSTVEQAGSHLARLRVETDPDVRLKVSALPAGVEVRLERGEGADAATPAAGELKELLAVADETGVSVLLTGSGPFQGKVFTLENPSRVVVDLPGVVNKVTRRSHPVGAVGVQRVRVGQFATAPEPIVRVVVDVDQTLPFKLEPNAHGAVLRLGGAASATPAVAAQAQPPVAPVPSSPAPAIVEAEKPAPVKAAETVPPPVTTPEKAPEPVQAPPVKIVDEPTPIPAATAPAPTETVAPSKTESLTSPPVATAPAPAAPAPKPAAAAPKRPPSDSPWTTTPAALTEQAAPPAAAIGATREVESQERRFTGEPISFELKDADIKDVLRTFARITGLNIVVDPDVTGSVTVNLDNVPWDQCLDVILRINRLDYVVENNVLRVARLDRLTQEKAAIETYRKQEEKAKPMRTVTKSLSYAKAAQVSTLLSSQGFILSERGSVVVDDRTNQLIIRDAADRLEGILNLIDSLDTPNPQVIIEARIVETTRTFSRTLGMTWGLTGIGDAAHGTATKWKFPHSYTGSGNVNLAKPGNGVVSMTFADILNAFNLDFTLSAAESNGLVKIVSSPKVTAQNNKKAHIQSGLMIPIQTIANNTVTVQYIDATLSLDVTPQITAEGTVLLEIDLKKREPLAGINLQGGQNAPLSTRDAKTEVLVRDGGTTVIGGIYQFTDQDQRNGIPVLNRIPILGALFRNKDLSNRHDELLIFITPRIVKY